MLLSILSRYRTYRGSFVKKKVVSSLINFVCYLPANLF